MYPEERKELVSGLHFDATVCQREKTNKELEAGTEAEAILIGWFIHGLLSLCLHATQDYLPRVGTTSGLWAFPLQSLVRKLSSTELPTDQSDGVGFSAEVPSALMTVWLGLDLRRGRFQPLFHINSALPCPHT